MAVQRFDAIVGGVGQAGKPLPLDLGGAGRRTAVIEREHVGGTAWRAADYGVRCRPVGVDMAQVYRRKQAIVDDFRASEPKVLQDAVIGEIAAGLGKTAAQVCSAWGPQRGTAILTTSTNVDRIRESVEVSPLPDRAMEETKGARDTLSIQQRRRDWDSRVHPPGDVDQNRLLRLE
jgi:hypothetical protein